MDPKDFIELIIKHGWPVVIALAAYRIVNLVFDWLSQAEPVGMLKGLFNRRRQRLEKNADASLSVTENPESGPG